LVAYFFPLLRLAIHPSSCTARTGRLSTLSVECAIRLIKGSFHS